MRLVTTVDIADDDHGPDAQRMSVSVLHEAVLADGRRVVLLDDRGWSEQLASAAPPGVWSQTSVEDLEREARVVVGPDEPFEDRTPTEMAAGHWETLAQVLRHEGVEADAAEMSTLVHDVELSERVLARVGGPREV